MEDRGWRMEVEKRGWRMEDGFAFGAVRTSVTLLGQDMGNT
jgi:hypothetical protein